MKIIIDARTGFGTGVGRYSLNLLAWLEKLDTDNEYLVLLQGKDFYSWLPTAKNFRKVLADYPIYSWREQLLLPLKLWSLRPDLVHFTAFNVPLAYFGRFAVTIHDFTLVDFHNLHESLPHRMVYPIKYRVMRLILRHAIMTSAAIFTTTQYTKAEVTRRYGKRAGRKAYTTWLAADSSLNVTPQQPPYAPADPFLFYVGNSYPHKNLERLIAAFEQIKRLPLKLVLVGQQDYFYAKLQNTAEKRGLSNVLMPGYAADRELAWLYQNAQLFVFPSLSEGFGLPPLEAMAYGTPVISSNASCMPEVLGDAAAYFDPADPSDMAKKIEALLDNKSELSRLRKAGPERVKQFSWEKMARETLAVYKKALNSK